MSTSQKFLSLIFFFNNFVAEGLHFHSQIVVTKTEKMCLSDLLGLLNAHQILFPKACIFLFSQSLEEHNLNRAGQVG